MQCKNHPEVVAVDRCAGCAEPFCSDCLVDIHGQKYCGACKTMALRGGSPIVEEATIPCKEANEALTFAIVGLFCFIFLPFAIVKALKAKKMIEMNPQLSGAGKATAGLITAIVGLVLAVLVAIAKISALAQQR